jgi:trehalose/maltose hydrolase-like predicted phosphorylase
MWQPSQQQGAEAVVAAHVDAWRRRWDAAEVSIVGDDEAQQALRFAVYHLVAAAGRGDEHASIGARGLTGLPRFQSGFVRARRLRERPTKRILTCPPQGNLR